MNLKSNFGIIIDRAINELRTGRPIAVNDGDDYWLFFNVEHSQKKILNQFEPYLDKKKYLLITKQKAKNSFNNKITSNIYFEIDDKTINKTFINFFINPVSIEYKDMFKDIVITQSSEDRKSVV